MLNQPHQWTYRKYALDAFRMEAEIATSDEITQLIGSSNGLWNRTRIKLGILPKSHIIEPYFHFNPTILTLQAPLYLDGYWQSERYFEGISETLRQELRLQKPLSTNAQKQQSYIKNEQSVSLHIRRGDYLNTSKANRWLSPCSLEYYQNAIDYISQHIENPTFFVFSDDLDWAKAHLSARFNVHFVTDNLAYEDLQLMADCQHHIISNSTFGWWGAWLNPNPHKIVVVPNKWFDTQRFNTKDLLPESWIRL